MILACFCFSPFWHTDVQTQFSWTGPPTKNTSYVSRRHNYCGKVVPCWNHLFTLWMKVYGGLSANKFKWCQFLDIILIKQVLQFCIWSYSVSQNIQRHVFKVVMFCSYPVVFSLPNVCWNYFETLTLPSLCPNLCWNWSCVVGHQLDK